MKQTYSDEFYNHLYRLESYNKIGESWSRKADKNNPDLIWIRNYIKENNLFDEYNNLSNSSAIACMMSESCLHE